MADAMSNALASSLLNLVLRNTAYNPANPNYLWIGLFHASTGLNGGSLADEVVKTAGGNYARAQINLQSNQEFTESTNGSVVQNQNDISFATVTGTPVTDDWAVSGNEVTAAAIIDSSTLGAGTILIWGDFVQSKTIVVGDQFKLLAGDFKIQFT